MVIHRRYSRHDGTDGFFADTGQQRHRRADPSNVTAAFSEDVQASTIGFVLKAGSTTIPTVTTYDVASRVVTLDPSSNLTPGTTYTATLSGAKDLSGNTMTSTSWSFTTAAVTRRRPLRR